MPEVPSNPVLSAGFERARKLSRVLVVLLTVGLALMVAGLIGFSVYMFSPELQELVGRHVRHPIRSVGWGKYALVLLGAIPCFLALHYARRLFQRFAAGDVFSLPTIDLMRTAALWITVAGIIPPRPLTLVIGMATYVAAYVMAEACRLADDNASII